MPVVGCRPPMLTFAEPVNAAAAAAAAGKRLPGCGGPGKPRLAERIGEAGTIDAGAG